MLYLLWTRSQWERFCLSISVFHCHYHSTIAPYSFIHLPLTLYNVFLPVLQFSPVSTNPPFLHTHSSIYHPHFINFFSQYFSFPCQYHSTIAPYSFIHLPHTLYKFFLPVLQFPCQYHSTIAPYSFIHLSPTLYNIFLPVLQFPLSVSFHHCSILIHPSTTHTI